jgi:epoxyqueuosine reductase QueG
LDVHRALELEKQQLQERIASLAAESCKQNPETAERSTTAREENAIRMLKQEVDALRQELEVRGGPSVLQNTLPGLFHQQLLAQHALCMGAHVWNDPASHI